MTKLWGKLKNGSNSTMAMSKSVRSFMSSAILRKALSSAKAGDKEGGEEEGRIGGFEGAALEHAAAEMAELAEEAAKAKVAAPKLGQCAGGFCG